MNGALDPQTLADLHTAIICSILDGRDLIRVSYFGGPLDGDTAYWCPVGHAVPSRTDPIPAFDSGFPPFGRPVYSLAWMSNARDQAVFVFRGYVREDPDVLPFYINTRMTIDRDYFVPMSSRGESAYRNARSVAGIQEAKC